MKIITKNDNTWIIEDDGVRCFLIEGNEKAALIDTGMHIENIKELVESLTDKPLLVLNTHADRDHIGGNHQFDTVYMSAHEMAHYCIDNYNKQIIALYDGDIIDLGNRKLEVIDIPGHTPGSIGFYDVDKRILISGDPIQKDGNVFMFGVQRNLYAYISGLNRLNKRKDDFDEIWPSHGTLPIDNSYIEKCRNDVQDLIDGKLSYELQSRFNNVIRAYKGKENIYLTDDKQI